ncbi:MAG: response regulator [Chloroflexi bacterium]|nr:MAG: response regulator [Chloroflexota bacterium]TME17369.1 MAG: response regulator [Chloroflexota bacterium]
MTEQKLPRILVVDDIRANSMLIEAYLKPMGYEVMTVDSGLGALELARESPPDLVLLDVRLPDLDGFEVCRKLREEQATSLVPIVMVTSLNATEDRVKALEAGADDFLSKPVDRLELNARVHSMIELNGLRERVDAERRETLLSAFERYFPERESLEMISRGQELEESARESDVTILYADIRGFTAFSERLEPNQVVPLLNTYFTEMVTILFDHGGTLISFIGDAMLATFGLPRPNTDDADRAFQTALAMRARLDERNLAGTFAAVGGLRIGVAIHSGQVIAGTIGAPQRMEYTIIGDAVNTAVRIEGLNKRFGTWLVLSEAASQRISSQRPLRGGDEVQLRGREQPLRVFMLADDPA